MSSLPNLGGRSRTPVGRRRPSPSPPRRQPRPRYRDGTIIIERTVERRLKDIGSAKWPMLTKTNYGAWAAMMRVMLKSRKLWDAVNLCDADEDEDEMALEAICKAVPEDMVEVMANKSSARAAWEDIKTANLGVERVRKAKAQTLRKEFDSLSFKDGESVSDFQVRITKIAQQLRTLGDDLDETVVVRRFLQAVPKQFHQIAMSIETLLELGDIPLEDLVGRLKAAEERYELTGGGAGVAQLNFTEDELVARVSKRLQINSDKGAGSSSGSSGGQPRGRGGGRGGGRDKTGRGGRQKGWDGAPREKKGNGGARSNSRDVVRDECRYCGVCGHWAKECPKRRRDSAHLAQAEEEEEAHTLLLATAVEEVNATPSLSAPAGATATPSPIHLDESHLFVQLGERSDGATTRWILDSGATNHMTGARSAFADLDGSIRGSVRFGDGSTVVIEGRGTVLFKGKTGEHQKLVDVYHIPRLTANIISLGQLEEKRFKILLEDGALKIWNPQRRLVAIVQRAANRLYILNTNVDKPVCLAAHAE
ncbi:uncharacterized protein [Setaria viridis]|uniref:uncharacterized protein n=1 Tax=Setaria viridis TaxID=4556 RepID=UPI003B3B8212